jgi:hypothetical protein
VSGNRSAESDPRFTHRPLNGCSGCRQDFSSVAAFDRHRVGSFDPFDRRCMDETEMLVAGMEVDERGRWRIALSDEDRERLRALKGSPYSPTEVEGEEEVA